MTAPDTHQIFLDELAIRWRRDMDSILALAINGSLPLWISFTDVSLQATEPPGARRRKTGPVKILHSQVEVSPQPNVLIQAMGRFDRMIIAAELPCLDTKGKAVTVTNSVGEEWGEISMIGLKPNKLFARLADILRCEREQGITPLPAEAPAKPVNKRTSKSSSINQPAHPWHAPELDIACQCWQTLYAQAPPSATPPKKITILSWLRQHHPKLTQAAAERIARVVMPADRSPR